MANRTCGVRFGTRAGYYRHRKAKEPPCPECRAAVLEYQMRRAGGYKFDRVKCEGGCGRTAPASLGWCSKCRHAHPERPTNCAWCGASFESTFMFSRGTWGRCCSRSCAGKLQVANGRGGAVKLGSKYSSEAERLRIKSKAAERRRRARRAGVPSERYTKQEIAERDGWICGLCRAPVDPAAKWPSVDSSSIDHVVPMSLGGSDLKSNVQLAHFRCNAAKGARV